MDQDANEDEMSFQDSKHQQLQREYAEMPDEKLLARFREGSEDAATALYFRYASRLQNLADNQSAPRMAVRMDTEGVVQSVFRTFFRRAKSGQYEVADGEDLWNLFLVIALNKIRTTAKHHRAQKRDVEKTQTLADSAGTPNASTDIREEEALNVLKLTINELLEKLPNSNKDIVFLRIDGFEVSEIAEKTGRAKRTVERIIQNFKRRLKEIIDQNNG